MKVIAKQETKIPDNIYDLISAYISGTGCGLHKEEITTFAVHDEYLYVSKVRDEVIQTFIWYMRFPIRYVESMIENPMNRASFGWFIWNKYTLQQKIGYEQVELIEKKLELLPKYAGGEA